MDRLKNAEHVVSMATGMPSFVSILGAAKTLGLRFIKEAVRKKVPKTPASSPQQAPPEKPIEPPWPADLPPLEEYVKRLREQYILHSTLFITDKTLRPSLTGTWIGRVVAGAVGESWPEVNGRPMIGVCQLDLTSAPHVPEAIREFKLVTFFLEYNEKTKGFEIPVDESKWVIRAYRHDQELVAYEWPRLPYEFWKPCGARATELIDHGDPADQIFGDAEARGLPREWADGIQEYIERMEAEEEAAGRFNPDLTYGTKLGGWPAPVQDPDPRPLTFQIGSEPDVNMDWVHQGCIYVWYSEKGWEVDCAFY